MGADNAAAEPGLHDHLHNRKQSLALLAREGGDLVHISKAGYLWKRGSWRTTWLRRWMVVRKGVFRQGKSPGEVRCCWQALQCTEEQ